MFYNLIVNQPIKMLKNLDSILDKGAAFADSKKFPMENLLNARLAPDQFNLTKQIQIACDSAKLNAARLTGKDAPVHEDNETNLMQLKERIQDVTKWLNSLNEADFKDASNKKITTPRWDGKHLTGEEFVLEYGMPNLYFHISTAYAILRNNGIDIGKKDYLGELPFKK